MDQTTDARHMSLYAQLGALLQTELAPFPGRIGATWRHVAVSAIVIVTSMALQVPFLALSLIMVFFTLQENTVLTRASGIMLSIGATIGIALAILLLMHTYDYPLLRILGAGLIGFCGIYFMRISKLGALGYLVALVVLYLQSLIEVVNGPEVYVRSALWCWVAIVYPIVISILASHLLVPADPGCLLDDDMVRQLDEVREQLEAHRTQAGARPASLDVLERGTLSLHRHLSFATQGDRHYRQNHDLYRLRIDTIDRLSMAALKLSRISLPDISPAQKKALLLLQKACGSLQQTIRSRTSGLAVPPALYDERPGHGPCDVALQEMAHALESQAAVEALVLPAAPRLKNGLISADAFSNPVYGQFALKTVLSALLCYVFYTAVQWPGIHTSLITCLILALPSVGAIAHRGLLRIAGCVLGSMVSLLATIFVIPHLDGIVGLLLLTLPIIAVGAWISAGSPKTNYIGMQFVFAFALSSLNQFGPGTDLTEIRDRLVGILIGVTVSVFVYSAIWPERESTALRQLRSRLLARIAELARAGRGMAGEGAGPRQVDGIRLSAWSLLAQNRELQARVVLEYGWQYIYAEITEEMQIWIFRVQETLFATNWLQTMLTHTAPDLPAAAVDAVETFLQRAAASLDMLADAPARHSALGDDGLSISLARLDSLGAQYSDEEPAARRIGALIAAAHAMYECTVQLGNHPFLANPVKSTP